MQWKLCPLAPPRSVEAQLMREAYQPSDTVPSLLLPGVVTQIWPTTYLSSAALTATKAAMSRIIEPSAFFTNRANQGIHIGWACLPLSSDHLPTCCASSKDIGTPCSPKTTTARPQPHLMTRLGPRPPPTLVTMAASNFIRDDGGGAIAISMPGPCF